MAVWSEVNFSEVAVSTRFDAEFYKPLYLRYASLMQKGILLQAQAAISHPTEVVRVYEEKGIQILLAQNIRANRLDFSNSAFMASGMAHELRRNLLQTNDVVMTRSGANYGDTAVYKGTPADLYACADVLILRPYDMPGGYLSTFFNTEMGRAILDRGAYGAAQPHIAPNYLNGLRVPRFPNEERTIDGLIEAAYAKEEQSDKLYAEAEALLLDALGLNNLDAANALAYEADFLTVAMAGRFDTDYFQPKYTRVREALKKLPNCKIVPLENIVVELTNGQTPLHHDLSVGDIPFLTAEHVADFRINFDSSKRILAKHHAGLLKRTRLKPEDVLITIKGRVGNAAVVENLPGPTNINQDVAVMRLQEGVPPYYLAGFLNSLAGKLLTEQVCTGQINPFLGLGNLKTVPVPIFSLVEMQRLAQLVKNKIGEAFAAAQSAQNLLEAAKRRVEELIEEGA